MPQIQPAYVSQNQIHSMDQSAAMYGGPGGNSSVLGGAVMPPAQPAKVLFVSAYLFVSCFLVKMFQFISVLKRIYLLHMK